MKQFYIFLITILIFALESCSTAMNTTRIAEEWCECMNINSESNSSQSKSTCDSIAKVHLDVLLMIKIKEAKERNFPEDSFRRYLSTTHLEYHDLTQKCRKGALVSP